MNLKLKTNRTEFYRKYYQSINGVLKLTNKELNILSILSNRKLSGIEDKDLFSSKSREYIAKALDISKFNLNNYIKAMVDRKIILRIDKKLSLNPHIYRDIRDIDSVNFSFSFEIND